MKRRGPLRMTKSALGAARIILKNLPLWLFALLTVAGFNAIALGGLVCTRRFGQSLGLYTVDNETVGAIFSAILVMYAISLGFIAVASWGNASAAAAAASEEASHIATVYRTLGGFPLPLQDDLKDSLVRYTQSIIEKAWPAQQRREVTEAGIEIILHLWSRITQFEPTRSSAGCATRLPAPTATRVCATCLPIRAPSTIGRRDGDIGLQRRMERRTSAGRRCVRLILRSSRATIWWRRRSPHP